MLFETFLLWSKRDLKRNCKYFCYWFAQKFKKCKFYTFHLDFEENGAISRLLGFSSLINHLLFALLGFPADVLQDFFFFFFSEKSLITTWVWCCTKKWSKLCHGFFSFFIKQYWLIWNKLLTGTLTCVFWLTFISIIQWLTMTLFDAGPFFFRWLFMSCTNCSKLPQM